jgi:hypothetical protein
MRSIDVILQNSCRKLQIFDFPIFLPCGGNQMVKKARKPKKGKGLKK